MCTLRAFFFIEIKFLKDSRQFSSYLPLSAAHLTAKHVSLSSEIEFFFDGEEIF